MNIIVIICFRKQIEIGIIDNDVYEDDEQFHVRLSDIRAVCDTNEQQTIRADLGTNSLATILIIDDDHGGAFTFGSEYYKVPENQGVFTLEVCKLVHEFRHCYEFWSLGFTTSRCSWKGFSTLQNHRWRR